jgi:hypothetical protein
VIPDEPGGAPLVKETFLEFERSFLLRYDPDEEPLPEFLNIAEEEESVFNEA